jgi:hypothetical protein
MVHEGNRKRTILCVLFLLSLMVYAQSAASFSAPEPHDATGHCCLLCHVGTLPFLQITTVLAMAPVLQVERLIPNPDFEASHDVLLNANSSRAPPA